MPSLSKSRIGGLMVFLLASICRVTAQSGLSGVCMVHDCFLYPSNEQDGLSTPLYFGLMQAFSGEFIAGGAIGGIEVALDQINNNDTILPGYTLHYILTDSKCNRTLALEKFFYHINNGPKRIAWLGSGCSVATEPTAEVSHYYNLVQISCVSSSPALKNRERFRRYFQILRPEDRNSFGFFAAIRRYRWKHVAIITQDENIFTETVGSLKELLARANITYSETRFRSEDSVEGFSDSSLFDPQARIFVLSMYETNAREVFCRAYRIGMVYPTHIYLTYNWYTPNWWLVADTVNNCTAEEMESVVPFGIQTGLAEFITNQSAVAGTGINGTEFETLYNAHLNQAPLFLENSPWKVSCYDATWALAKALNATMHDINSNETLRRLAGEEAGLANPLRFSLEDFMYDNAIIAKTMFRHLENTDFVGLSENVIFDDQGIREGAPLELFQYRYVEGENGTRVLKPVVIAYVEGDYKPRLEYLNDESDGTVWPDGIPYDGIPIEEVVTVSVALTVVYVLLATAGIGFTIACLIFNFVFRKKKLIRLSSPNLNYFIGLGAILLYVDVYLSVIPTTDRDVVTVLCNIIPWLTSLGYSLIFGTILAKMARVYFIFHNPSLENPSTRHCVNVFQDSFLVLVVIMLVIVDLVILVVYTAVEGANGNLSAIRLSSNENSMDMKGTFDVIYEYYFYTCFSHARKITLGILYGYKGVLQVVSLLIAFQIRRVKVKGLNDAKYIAAAIYVTSIILAVTILSNYSLVEQVNGFVAVFGMGLLVGTTAILGLAFVPKMIGLYQDPEGEKVFDKRDHQSSYLQQLTNANGLCDMPETVDQLKKEVLDLRKELAYYKDSAGFQNERFRKSSNSSSGTEL